jgi:DNA topoisomerase-1
MFKASGRGAKKPFCINESCKNFLPEDKRGYKRKPKTDEDKSSAEESDKQPSVKKATKKPAKRKTTKKSATRKAASRTKTKTPAKKATSKTKASGNPATKK